ncbi:MAG: DUF58 domain-containing protein [Balneolaceae bacterium]|nr:DUF58 domain-containing protein [Balneolaceae bacterium]
MRGFISGLHKSLYATDISVEFAEHRPDKVFGVELKHVDERNAKTERFYVKRYEEETNLRAYLLLDTSSSMYFKHFAEWTKLRYGINFGAALLYLMHRQRDATGLIPFSDEIEAFIPAKSSYSHLRLIFNELEKRLDEEQQGIKEGKRTASAKVIARQVASGRP